MIGTDVDDLRLAEHRTRGGVIVETPYDVACHASAIITSLPSDTALLEVIAALHGLETADRQDLVIIETSTLSLDAKRTARALAQAAGITLLDCPVSGSAPQALAGELVAYVSGDDSAKSRASDVMGDLVSRWYDVGAFGNGSRFKFVTNMLVAVHTLAAAEALLLARRLGLDFDRVLEVVGNSAGTSRMLELRGPLMADEGYSEPFVRIRTFLKDLDLIDRAAETAGSPTPLLTRAASYYRGAQDAGRGDQDAAAVFAFLEAGAGPSNEAPQHP